MANIEEVSGVYGGVKVEENAQAGVIGGTENITGNGTIGIENAISIETGTKVGENLPVKRSFWDKVKSVLFYEIKVELTPYEQKVEDEVNEFLHQEITWKKVKDFLFQEITFGKKTDL